MQESPGSSQHSTSLLRGDAGSPMSRRQVPAVDRALGELGVAGLALAVCEECLVEGGEASLVERVRFVAAEIDSLVDEIYARALSCRMQADGGGS